MTKFLCPKCKTEIKPENINGLYFTCESCGYLDDSTFDMIIQTAEFNRQNREYREAQMVTQKQTENQK